MSRWLVAAACLAAATPGKRKRQPKEALRAAIRKRAETMADVSRHREKMTMSGGAAALFEAHGSGAHPLYDAIAAPEAARHPRKKKKKKTSRTKAVIPSPAALLRPRKRKGERVYRSYAADALPLFVLIVKTGGTEMEAFLHRLHGDARCSLRPKDDGRESDYAAYFARERARLLDACAVISGEVDWSFVDVVTNATNRTVLPFTLLREPTERAASYAQMRLRQFGGAMPCVPGAPSTLGAAVTALADGEWCATAAARRCCLAQRVPRKCLEAGICGAARNLMTQILAGVDAAGVAPFDAALAETPDARENARAALQADADGGERLLAAARAHASALAFAGFTRDLPGAFCAYLRLGPPGVGATVARNEMKRQCGQRPAPAPAKYARAMPGPAYAALEAANALDARLYAWAAAAGTRVFRPP